MKHSGSISRQFVGRATCLAIAFSLTTLTAFAQSAPEDTSYVGASVRSRPAYDGSPLQRTTLIPVVRYYGHPWFARTTQGVLEGGARTTLAGGLALGAQLAYEPGRQASESDLLRNHNVADIGAAASVGAHLEFDRKLGAVPINLLGRVRQNTDSDRGAQVDLRFSGGVYANKRMAVGVFVQETWGNARSSGSNYGISQAESATTGFPAFQAGRGFLFAAVGFIGSIELSREWVALWSVESRRLQGDAAGSPLTERTSNHYFSTGLAYRF